MRLQRIIPLVSFVFLVLWATIALREREPYQPAFRVSAAAPTLPRPVLTRGSETFAGRVVDESGASVPEALVGLWQNERLYWVNADAQGAFELNHLDAGDVRVSVVAPGFTARVLEARVGAGEVTLNLGARVPDAPRIAPVEWVDLTGQIANVQPDETTDYELLFEPTVVAEFRVGVVPRRARVDRRGGFLVPRLAPATYRIALLPPWAHGGREPDLLRGLDDAPLEFEHIADLSAPRTLQLEARAATVVGLVTQARVEDPELGPLVEPVEGAQIRVRPQAENSLEWPPTTTASDGSYAIRDLPAGTYVLQMLHGTSQEQRTIELKAQETLQVDFDAR